MLRPADAASSRYRQRHAPAMIPLDLDDINADFYGAGCHKWPLAPTGSGSSISAKERRPPATAASELGLAA